MFFFIVCESVQLNILLMFLSIDTKNTDGLTDDSFL